MIPKVGICRVGECCCVGSIDELGRSLEVVDTRMAFWRIEVVEEAVRPNLIRAC